MTPKYREQLWNSINPNLMTVRELIIDYERTNADRDRLAERVKQYEERVKYIRKQLNCEGSSKPDACFIEELQQRLATAEAELKAYREGGVTEEILRRNDGFIKLGRGCMIVREDEHTALTQRLAGMEQRIRELENDSCK